MGRYPVAQMLSNREDAMTMNFFFSAFKEMSCVISPKWFMSLDADNYSNAWRGVFMVNKTQKFVSAWHLDRTQRKTPTKHMNDKQEQIRLYHHLSILSNEHNKLNFELHCKTC